MLIEGKKVISKEYTEIFFNMNKQRTEFMYVKCDNNSIPIQLCYVLFDSFYIFKFQKLQKLKNIAKDKYFVCWCPFNDVDKFWLSLRKEKLKKLEKLNDNRF
jgi:hypothetical protein